MKALDGFVYSVMNDTFVISYHYWFGSDSLLWLST